MANAELKMESRSNGWKSSQKNAVKSDLDGYLAGACKPATAGSTGTIDVTLDELATRKCP